MEGEKDHFKRFDLPEHGRGWTLAVIFRLLWLIGACIAIYHLFWFAYLDYLLPDNCIFQTDPDWKEGIPYGWCILVVIAYSWELIYGYTPQNSWRAIGSLSIFLIAIPWLTWPAILQMSDWFLIDGLFSLPGLIFIWTITSQIGLLGNRINYLLPANSRSSDKEQI